ncbi:unnamed protein product [Spirodela intermedia]|uniref:C2H2-type domain-containing protein n=1 Tax=Spirodela intermedia TaxID=51605 RepID=A0A7I8J8Z5_SPIIN|nr:unnamed protein product [Spirodela intermedia]CAA6666559.1 unnamed protein product [Spirodela intermedia]
MGGSARTGGQEAGFSHKTARRTKFLLKDILPTAIILFASFSPAQFHIPNEIVPMPRDDMVYDELLKLVKTEAVEAKSLPLNEDLPGMGQFYCLHCDRYFATAEVRDEHFKTKLHKKRVKQMMGPAPHTQLDADLAAGMGMPDNGPKLMSV